MDTPVGLRTEGDDAVEVPDFDLDELISPPKKNCTNCLHYGPSCGTIICKMDCLWGQIGVKCFNETIEVSHALVYLVSSASDVEIECPGWEREAD